MDCPADFGGVVWPTDRRGSSTLTKQNLVTLKFAVTAYCGKLLLVLSDYDRTTWFAGGDHVAPEA
jgi:hypothetical protein